MTTHRMLVDIETFSDVDITKAGLYKYAQSPAFDILLIAWAVDDGPVRLIDCAIDSGAEGAGREWQALQDFYHDLYDPANALHAYNAAFEHYCINTWLERQGRAPIPLSRWHCTMAHASYCGYPGSLAMVGEAIGLPEDQQKMAVGKALIRKFCVPQKPKAKRGTAGQIEIPLADESGSRTREGAPEGRLAASTPAVPPRSCRDFHKVIAAEPEKWELFKTYCRQDVATEREIERRLARWPMPGREQQLWELTTEANIAGVAIDLDLVRSAIAVGEAEQAELIAEAREITGLDNPKSTQQLMNWLTRETGEDLPDLRKTTVAELLDAGVNSEAAERALELRQLISKTSTTKYNAMDTAVCADGRVRGLMAYYGAGRTGRWAGRIVQPQNLPQNHLKGMDAARELVKARDMEMLRLCWGSIPDTLSQLIRTAFIPGRLPRPEGGVAATRPDLLRCAPESGTASRSQARFLPVGCPAAEAESPTESGTASRPQARSLPDNPQAKPLFAVADYSAIEARVVAWLAGEQWVLEAFRRGEDIYCATASQMFGVPVQKHGVNGELRQRGKVATLALGYGGGEAALISMGALRMGIPEGDLPEIKAKWRAANPNICRLWRKVGDAAMAAVEKGGTTSVPVWGTGQRIVFRMEAEGDQKFLTVELPAGRKLFYARPFIAPSKKKAHEDALFYYQTNQSTRKWGPTDTWGGKLVENITQAVARDCLAETLLALRAMGRNPVFHVHDEVICEVDDASELDAILDIMAAPVPWAPGLPLKGAGFVCDFYQKD